MTALAALLMSRQCEATDKLQPAWRAHPARTLGWNTRKRERVRCSPLFDWPVYPGLRHEDALLWALQCQDGQCRIHIEAARAKPRGRGLAAPVLSARPNARSYSLHRFGVAGECDRIRAVSEGLIRLILVLAIQSFLRPPSESCHQWSRSNAISARADNDLQCAFPAGRVPVSKLPTVLLDSHPST